MEGLSAASGRRAVSSGTAPPSQTGLREGVTLAQGRLSILRRLGQGGMGTVYLAHDRDRRSNVALKTLNQLDASSIYALKNEFRALSDVHHPNLVGLHELFCDQDAWFFTMDLIEGERFDRWVRPHDRLDEPRLRVALLSLVDALEAIHGVGKLHRDIKPSNVLVTEAGRLVVLDFGLVIDPIAGTVGQTVTDTDVTGTPDYMAPEQAAGRAISSATDFYAVGVMIFEALVGRRPFEGSLGEILAAKQRDRPPRLTGRDLPNDLSELATALLAREPELRPGAREIRARLEETASPRSSGTRELAARDEEPGQLLGREAELALLREAYAAAVGGKPVIVALSAESGMGKTAVCRAFLSELRSAGHAVVLSGRCYEHENVPFKVIDPLIDELSRHLRRSTHAQASALLPRDAFALAQLFPVLLRVRAFAEAPAKPVAADRELQRLAFVAFGELLARIRDRQPLVIHIDDLQWTDVDSAKFLRQLLISRLEVAVLFIVGFRAGEEQENPLLRSVIEAAAQRRGLDLRRVRLAPLDAAQIAALARRCLPPDYEPANIAAEARGNPFFAMELARFARSPVRATSGTLTLPAVIEARVATLPCAARRLLQALAIAGQPLSTNVLLAASDAEHADLDALRAAHLIRGCSERAGERMLECYHDRVRESVAAACAPAERVERERALARALAGRDEPELLSRCLEGAGERAAASDAAALAADRAASALAFDHAAQLYQRALDLSEAAPRERGELLTRLGRSLENAGRGSQAADAYLAAAELAHGVERRELRRRATEQLLVCGHVERGIPLLRGLCAELGIRFPNLESSGRLDLAVSTVAAALAPPAAPLAISNAAPLGTEAALRLRTLKSAATGLINYYPVHAASIAYEYYRAARACPDAVERTRATGFFAHAKCLLAPYGAHAASLLADLDALAQAQGQAELLGFNQLMRGTGSFMREAYPAAREHFERARRALRPCTGVDWELDAISVYDQLAAFYAGAHADIAHDTPLLLEEAERRQRAWAVAMLSGFAGMPAWLASGDVRGYQRQLSAARSSFGASAAGAWPDYVLTVGEALLAIYTGQPERGFELIEQQREAYRRASFTERTVIGGVGYATHRGTCAAALLGSGVPAARRRSQLLAVLRQTLATLRRRGGPKSAGMCALFEAARAWSAGERERALSELARAGQLLEAAQARMHAAAIQRRLGLLIGGDEGARARAAGESFMHSQGVRELEAMTALHCPGFGSS